MAQEKKDRIYNLMYDALKAVGTQSHSTSMFSGDREVPAFIMEQVQYALAQADLFQSSNST